MTMLEAIKGITGELLARRKSWGEGHFLRWSYALGKGMGVLVDVEGFEGFETLSPYQVLADDAAADDWELVESGPRSVAELRAWAEWERIAGKAGRNPTNRELFHVAFRDGWEAHASMTSGLER